MLVFYIIRFIPVTYVCVCLAMVDAGGKVPVVQERGVVQGGTVLFQRHDQPGRRRAGRADRQRPAPDRLQSVLRLLRSGEPGAAEARAVGLRPVEQGGRLLSGVQHVGRAHTASDGEKRVGRSEGRPRPLEDSGGWVDGGYSRGDPLWEVVKFS